MYPGLMMTAALIHKVLHLLAFPVDIRNVCVFTAPVFSALTALATYLLTTEVTRKTQAGLLSALFIAIVPSYISRSVAGSYDYEGISIFILILTFYLFVRSVRTGSLLSALLTSLSYFYMVASWGGYTFIINIIPVYVIGMQFIGQFSRQLYVAYSVFYILGSILAMQIPFVGFQVVTSSEHLASHAVFFYLQAYMLSEWFRSKVGEQVYKSLVKLALISAASLCILYVLFVSLTGRMRWSGRSMSLLDPTYAKKFIPIIASVSEH
jgi:dolichyl-diphosphooligosaccharide--protein glycosyltransferase